MIHIKRFFEIYDENKLSKEDRRLIFQYVTESALFNTNCQMTNAALMLSIVSILIATFSAVYSINNGFTVGTIITGIGNVIIFLWVLYLYINSNKKVNEIIKGNIQDQDQVSKKHFEYAKRKGS